MTKPNAPEASNEKPVLNIDGKTYVIADLPQQVQSQLKIYNQWSSEKDRLSLDVAKIEYALKSLSLEITATVHQWENPSAANDSAVPTA